MEAHLSSNNVISVGTVLFDTVFSRHLDHCFVSFGTGVLVKDLVHSDGGTDLLGKKCLRNGIRIVEGMHKGLCLFNDRFYNLLVTASRGVDGNACIEIKILLSLFIIEILILGTFRKKIESFISFDHVLIYFILNILSCKTCFR